MASSPTSSSAASAASATGLAGPPPDAPNPASDSAASASDSLIRRSLIGQALYDTFGKTGARLGAAWIAVVAAMAVLAPFIANSHPWLLRAKGGGLSSPLIASLGPIDVALVVYAVYAGLVLFRRPTLPRVVGLLLWPPLALAAGIVLVRFGWPLLSFRIYRPDWLAKAGAVGRTFGWLWVIVVHLLLTACLAGLLWGTFKATAQLLHATRGTPREPIAAAACGLLMLAASLLVTVPPNPIYEQYRQAERAGQLSLVVRTIVPYSPNDHLLDEEGRFLQSPNRLHWLGTTNSGEDLLSRLLHACRVALAIGVIATGIATAIGIAVGGLMGYYSGIVDLLGMRVLEIIEAIPTLILLLIVTVFFGRNLYLMMVVIGLLSWTGDARFIRAEFLKLRNLDFVQAAVAAGLPRSSIIFKHMLPNGVAPVLVSASFGIAGAILLESTLSFLGLGLAPGDPSWGQLLNQARSGGRGFSWWIATFPGLAIFLTVFAYVVIGESLRDAIDPRLRKRD